MKFNNIEIERMIDLPRVVAEADVGSIAVVEVWRKNKIIEFEVNLGQLPEETYVTRDQTINEKIKNEIYIDLLDITVSSKKNDLGVLVTKTDNISKLNENDIITEVNREPIDSAKQFFDLVEKIFDTGRNSLLLKVLREENSLWITIQFKK